MPDGLNLNGKLIRQGWCWWFRKYAPGDTVLEGLEKRGTSSQERLVVLSAAGAAVGAVE